MDVVVHDAIALHRYLLFSCDERETTQIALFLGAIRKENGFICSAGDEVVNHVRQHDSWFAGHGRSRANVVPSLIEKVPVTSQSSREE